uniref:MADF domain-containing protein n=1 Tax=Rhodnius prolixus TaxID=13249 RepID=T1HAF1_RHOPR
MKWSESATVRFVELYREHDCLWNGYCKKYKNKEVRQKALESIREKMNWSTLSTDEIKQKIKNLRSTYNQELVKIKRSIISGRVGDDIYKPNVKWFPIMESVMMATKGLADSQANQELKYC